MLAQPRLRDCRARAHAVATHCSCQPRPYQYIHIYALVSATKLQERGTSGKRIRCRPSIKSAPGRFSTRRRCPNVRAPPSSPWRWSLSSRPCWRGARTSALGAARAAPRPRARASRAAAGRTAPSVRAPGRRARVERRARAATTRAHARALARCRSVPHGPGVGGAVSGGRRAAAYRARVLGCRHVQL